jgi:UDP-glucose 4-epimerase
MSVWHAEKRQKKGRTCLCALDATKLVSASDKARQELGWEPKRSTMKMMVSDAWRWHQNGHYSR